MCYWCFFVCEGAQCEKFCFFCILFTISFAPSQIAKQTTWRNQKRQGGALLDLSAFFFSSKVVFFIFFIHVVAHVWSWQCPLSQRKSWANASSYLIASSIRSWNVAVRRSPVSSQDTIKFWKEPSTLKQQAPSKVVARLGVRSSMNSPWRIMRYGSPIFWISW